MQTRRSFLMQSAAASMLAAANVPVTQAVAGSTAAASTPMKTYRIPHTDLVVSRIAFGAIALRLDTNGLRLINTVYDNGITFFDHADMYGEAPFGEVLKQSPGLRDRIVIQSKCGIVEEHGQTYFDCSRDNIVNAAEGSLQRIGTDHLDILLLHWPDALVEPEEVAKAFDELKRSGKVRYFGISNHSPRQIELLKHYVDQPLVANQIHLSLANPYLLAPRQGDPYEHASNYTGGASTVDYCRLHKMQLQAWSPLRGNLLKPPTDASPEMKHAAQMVADIAKEKSAPPSAVVLAWLLRHPAGIVPIFSSTKIEHVIANCAADRIILSRQEWYALLDAALGAQMQLREAKLR